MRALLLPLLTMLAACANPFSGDGGPGVTLANESSRAVVFSAVDLRYGPLVDPVPALDPAQVPERVLVPGEARALDIPEYSGEGVLLFLYEVPAGHAGGPVPFTRIVQVTAAELARLHHRVVLADD